MKQILFSMFLIVTFNVSAIEVNSKVSGTWYNSNQDGHGLNVSAYNEDITLVYWYVYHTDGSQMWLLTVGINDGNETTGTTYYYSGMKFGEFNPDDNTETIWGTTTVTFQDCHTATLTYSANDPAYGSGSIPMERLSSVPGLKCSDSPLHGNYHGFWVEPDEDGYGTAAFFENGDIAFLTEYDDDASTGIGTWWMTGNNSFSFDATEYLLSGGTFNITGSGTFNEDQLSATYTGDSVGQFYAMPMPSFQHGLTTEKMAGEFDIYDLNGSLEGSATVQSDGTFTGTTTLGCQISGTFDVPNTSFNQAYLLNTSISGCGDSIQMQGAAIYENETDEIAVAANDGWTGYVWTFSRK